MQPTKISLDELKAFQLRIQTGGLVEARLVYDELAAKGYGYAGWAGGVARGDTITGVSALDYLKGTAMMGLSAEACKYISPIQIDKVAITGSCDHDHRVITITGSGLAKSHLMS